MQTTRISCLEVRTYPLGSVSGLDAIEAILIASRAGHLPKLLRWRYSLICLLKDLVLIVDREVSLRILKVLEVTRLQLLRLALSRRVCHVIDRQ